MANAYRCVHTRADLAPAPDSYEIRFDRQRTAATKIVYMTDGCLLREALTDPTLSKHVRPRVSLGSPARVSPGSPAGDASPARLPLAPVSRSGVTRRAAVCCGVSGVAGTQRWRGGGVRRCGPMARHRCAAGQHVAGGWWLVAGGWWLIAGGLVGRG